MNKIINFKINNKQTLHKNKRKSNGCVINK